MDFYAILGITREATLGDVKRAYRRLARRFHPDINPGDSVAALRFQEIAQAYETLIDPDRRHRYDLAGVLQPDAEPSGVGFEGFDFTAAVHANLQSTFGDLFAEVLRREPGAGGGTARGADLHAVLTLEFEQALAGGEYLLTVTRQARCEVCRGTGALDGVETRCVQCQGSGALRSARGHMVFSRPCPRCGGTGLERRQRCGNCAASGVHVRTETVPVLVPPGIVDGMRLRVAERGHAGEQGRPAGDLYVTVDVRPHARFRREGDDLHTVLPIAIHEAALGARVDVATLQGEVRMRVPPGTQSGQRFRLRGRGAPSARDGHRGDLVVEVRLMLPKVLDERSKALLREFGEINQEPVRETG
jgi:molecular chaperone DnaJ